MSLSRAGAVLLAGGVLLALPAVLLASLPLLAAAGALLLALAAPAPPAPTSARRHISRRRVPRGATVDVVVEVPLPKGSGRCEIEQPLPRDAVVVAGVNVLDAPLDGRTARLALTVRLPAAGLQRFPPVRALAEDPLGLRAPVETRLAGTDEVEVLVAPAEGRLARGASTAIARPGQGSALSALGPEADGMRGVRAYAAGDPLRRINWKATARNLGRDPRAAPLVNEPERQGRRLLWVVVDTDPLLDAPTGDGRVLDRALEAAALAIDEAAAAGDEVGLVAGSLRHPPAIGRRSAARLVRELARVEAGAALVAPPVRRRSRVLLVTRLPFARDDVASATRKLLSAGARVTVLDVEGAPGLPREPAEAARRAIAELGARVVPWSPGALLEVRV